MTHPNIVTINTHTVRTRTYPSGFAALDVVADGDGALRSGEIFTIVGQAHAGRTSRMLRTVAGMTKAARAGEVVCIAVVTERPEAILNRPELRGLPARQLNAVRIAQVSSVAELALYMAQVAGDGETPIALLVDDLGVLSDGNGSTLQSETVLRAIASGSLASAVSTATGLPFGMFGLPADAAHIAPPVVVNTVRQRGTSRPDVVRMHAASHVVAVDGTAYMVYKSRLSVACGKRTEPEFFVAPDGADEPTLWERTDGDPIAVLRECDLPQSARFLWPSLCGHAARAGR